MHPVTQEKSLGPERFLERVKHSPAFKPDPRNWCGMATEFQPNFLPTIADKISSQRCVFLPSRPPNAHSEDVHFNQFLQAFDALLRRNANAPRLVSSPAIGTNETSGASADTFRRCWSRTFATSRRPRRFPVKRRSGPPRKCGRCSRRLIPTSSLPWLSVDLPGCGLAGLSSAECKRYG